MVDFLAGDITLKATPMPLPLVLAVVVFRVAVEGDVPSVVVEDVDGAGRYKLILLQNPLSWGVLLILVNVVF
jgi:hypothetical protein